MSRREWSGGGRSLRILPVQTGPLSMWRVIPTSMSRRILAVCRGAYRSYAEGHTGVYAKAHTKQYAKAHTKQYAKAHTKQYAEGHTYQYAEAHTLVQRWCRVLGEKTSCITHHIHQPCACSGHRHPGRCPGLVNLSPSGNPSILKGCHSSAQGQRSATLGGRCRHERELMQEV